MSRAPLEHGASTEAAATPGALGAVWRAARPPFLLLTPACVLLGYASAVRTEGAAAVETMRAFVVLAGALTAHAAVNLENEYHDFESGLDAMTSRTPFSGGSGTLPACPSAAAAVRRAAILAVAFTVVIGLYLVRTAGPALLVIDAIGVAIIASYTRFITRRPLVCLVAPGVGFGLVMVVGTHVALTGKLASLPVALSLVPTALVSNLLLLNQFPDMEADARVGRRHLLITLGVTAGVRAYAALAAVAAVVIVALAASGWVPVAALSALGPLSLSVVALGGASHHGAAIGRHPQYLAVNVLVALLTPMVLGVTLLAA